MIRIVNYIHLLLFCSFASYGQITYSPVFIDECTNDVTEVLWCLTDLENTYFLPTSNSKGVVVPEPRKYFLFCLNPTNQEVIEIPPSKSKSIIDTIQIFGLRVNRYVGYCDYTFCDSLANGRLKSYYQNGQLEMVNV